MQPFGATLRDAWRLARPFFHGDERWAARGLLAVVVALNLALVAMNVILTYWQRAFYNSLEAKDWDAFIGLLVFGRETDDAGAIFGFMPGLLRRRRGVHLRGGLPALPPPGPDHPLAPLDDPRRDGSLAVRPRLLPHGADRPGHRQSGPAHRRGHSPLH
jgi:hypothetical protein